MWGILPFLGLFVCCAGFEIFPQLTFESADGKSNCDAYRSLYRDSLLNQTEWAVRIWESSAQQPSGWVAGNVAQFGNFDECLATEAPIPLKYCLTQLHISVPDQAYPHNSVWQKIQNPPEDGLNIRRTAVWMGVCIPQECTPSLVSNRTVADNVSWALSTVECTNADQSIPVDYSAIAFLIVSGLLAILVIYATMLDAPRHDFKNYQYIINSFSLKRNFRTLIAPIQNPEGPVAIAHGLKVLSIFFIIFEHRFAIRYTLSAFNHEHYEKNNRDKIFQYTAQYDTTVDVFFFMSGLLLSYVGIPKRANAFAVIISRLFRLTPIYMYAVWMNASLMPYVGSGPLWNLMQGGESARCVKNWWLNLLYIQNYVRDEEMCNTPTWYLAAEFHCFLVGLVLLLALRWRLRVGLGMTAAVTVIAIIIPGVISYLMNLEPFFRFYHPTFLSNPLSYKPFKEMYIKSHNRIAVYLVGFIAGLYFSSSKDAAQKPNKQMSVIYFLMALVVMAAPAAYGMTMDTDNISVGGAVYAAVRRPVWGLGLFLLLLANKAHPLMIIQPLLTCRLVAIFSRLTFAIFVFHFPIVVAEFAAMRSPAFFTYYDVLNSSLGVYSSVAAFLSFLFLEQPLKLFLNGLCFPRPAADKSSQAQEQQVISTVHVVVQSSG